jgi:hypothetical protein
VAVAVGVALGLAGCGASQSSQIRAEVARLAQATANRQYSTLCEQILDPSLVVHLTSNGIACPAAMRVALGEVHQPTISVGKVTVHGRTATAIVLASARGERASVVAIELRRTGHGWRITSLGSPLSSGQGG